MKTMKRRIVLLSFLLVLALAMVACGTEPGATEPGIGEEADTTLDQPLEESEDLVAATPELGEDTAGLDEGTTDMGEDTVEVVPDASGDVTEPSDEMAETDLTTEEGVVQEDSGAIAGTVEPSPEPLTDDSQAAGEEPVIPATGAINMNNLSNMADFEIYNMNNEQIGDVEAIVIDMNSAQIKYIVAGVGGFLGLGEKSVAIPYQMASLNQPMSETDAEVDQAVQAGPNAFTVDVTAETLENAPEIDLEMFDTNFDLTGDEQSAEVIDEAMNFEQQEQAIRSYWEEITGMTFDDAQGTMTDESMNQAQDDSTGAVEESAVVTDSTTSEMTDSTMQSGMAQYVLAQQLLDANIVDQASMMNQQDADLVTEDEDVVGTEQDDADVVAEDESAMAETQGQEYQELGEVEDIVIDAQSGQVRYAAIDFNDDAFAAQDQVATEDQVTTEEQATTDEGLIEDDVLTPIPLQNLQWNPEEQTLSYDGTQPLQDLPTITYEQLQGDTGIWDVDIDNFWGIDNLDNEINETE
ncbi:MAG TPA: PRC-barrel domain-containing protein [Anaerolineae bacterium]|nr:PRC-barrel domain-containing protein [Anaerolineae bacterium]